MPRGPLSGIKVIEMAAIGPVPFAGMILADMGAEVIRVDRTAPSGLGVAAQAQFDAMGRGKKSICIDLKSSAGVGILKRLITEAHVLIEGFRPQVMERLGLGPGDCLALNPKLVFGRCSGWGEQGPYAAVAGHDINFIGLSGALAAMGVAGIPTPPLNLVGDFGGAGMHLAVGVLAGLISGQGQVVNASIAGSALGLMPMIYGLLAQGEWTAKRGGNLLDGGAPFYRCYEAMDGKFVAVGALERKFYIELITKLDLLGVLNPDYQNDRSTWPQTTDVLARKFRERIRDEWAVHFATSNACVTPVLTLEEAPNHPQQVPSFVKIAGVVQPAPQPYFSQSDTPTPPPAAGTHTREILSALQYSTREVDEMTASRTVASFSAQN